MDPTMLATFIPFGQRRSALPPGCGCVIGVLAFVVGFVAPLAFCLLLAGVSTLGL